MSVTIIYLGRVQLMPVQSSINTHLIGRSALVKMTILLSYLNYATNQGTFKQTILLMHLQPL